MSVINPIRSCCGQRHFGVQCPDGLVRCCICFTRVQHMRLSVIGDEGQRENVCLDCRAAEVDMIRRMAGRRGR